MDSRHTAELHGRRHYVAADACRRGHRAPRFTSNGVCTLCHRWLTAKSYAQRNAHRSPLHAEKARFYLEVAPVRLDLGVSCSPLQAQTLVDAKLRERFPLLMASGFTYAESTPVHWGGPFYTAWITRADAQWLRELTAPSTADSVIKT